jgi:outer membrane protein assembly factor BamA
VLVLVASTVACGHPPVHHPGEDYVAAVRFDGNSALDDHELGDGLAVTRTEQKAGTPDAYLIDSDVDRIRGNYARHGFLAADVHAKIERDPRGHAVTVVFIVKEGPRATTAVRIAGVADGELRDELRAVLPLADGAPFDYAAFDAIRETLVTAAQDAGYAHARLAARVYGDAAHNVVTVDLAYDLGPICRFGEVHVSGVTGDLAGAVRARVSFSPGDRYSTRVLNETQKKLYAIQRFATVRVQPADTDADVVAVEVAVAEGARHELKFGGGFGMDPLTYEARLRAGYHEAGWPSPLSVLDIDLRPAYAVLQDNLHEFEPRIQARATITRMDLLGVTDLSGIPELDYTYMVIEGWTVYGPGAQLGLLTPLGTPRVQLRADWRFAYFDFTMFNPLIDAATAAMLGIDHPERLGAFDETLSIDLTDNALEPHYGAYLDAHATEGTPYAGGADKFFKLTPEIRGYVPLGDATLAARLRVGRIDGTVPPSERYYAGGASSNRGFSERALSPTLAGDVSGQIDSIPIGGVAMIDSSLELRAPVGKAYGQKIGGVVFLDGGDVTLTNAELDPWNLHWSTGLGLRVLTLIGAVRIDVGYRLNRYGIDEPEPGSRWAFHIGLGEAF